MYLCRVYTSGWGSNPSFNLIVTFLALLDYVNRAHEIEIRPPSVRPSVRPSSVVRRAVRLN